MARSSAPSTVVRSHSPRFSLIEPDPPAVPAVIVPPAANLPLRELLAGKLPDFDPSWPEEVRTQWLECFRELLK